MSVFTAWTHVPRTWSNPASLSPMWVGHRDEAVRRRSRVFREDSVDLSPEKTAVEADVGSPGVTHGAPATSHPGVDQHTVTDLEWRACRHRHHFTDHLVAGDAGVGDGDLPGDDLDVGSADTDLPRPDHHVLGCFRFGHRGQLQLTWGDDAHRSHVRSWLTDKGC